VLFLYIYDEKLTLDPDKRLIFLNMTVKNSAAAAPAGGRYFSIPPIEYHPIAN
jgi:hypothetical protein